MLCPSSRRKETRRNRQRFRKHNETLRDNFVLCQTDTKTETDKDALRHRQKIGRTHIKALMPEILSKSELEWIERQSYPNKTRIKHSHRDIKSAKTETERDKHRLHAKLLGVPIMPKYQKEEEPK